MPQDSRAKIYELHELAGSFFNTMCSFRDTIDKVEEQYKRLDMRVNDLLHALEFTEDQNQARRIATQIRNTRIERREAKDLWTAMDLWMSVWKNPNILTTIQSSVSKTNGLINLLNARVYKPRTMTEEEFNDL